MGNKGMKIARALLMGFFLMAFTFTSNAQVWQWIPTPYEYNHVAATRSLLAPTGCGVPTGIGQLLNNKLRRASLYSDTCNNKMYWFNPKDSSWLELGGGGVTITGANEGLSVVGANTQLGVPFSEASTASQISATRKLLFGGSSYLYHLSPTQPNLATVQRPGYLNLAGDKPASNEGRILIDDVSGSTLAIRNNGTSSELTHGSARVGLNNSGQVNVGSSSGMDGSAKFTVDGKVQIKTGNEGAGKVWASDANGLGDWATPSTGGTPGGISGDIQVNNAGAFAGGPKWNSTTSTITTDSLNAKKTLADSSRLRPNTIGKARIGSGIIAVGNSMLVGTAATTTDSAYITMITDTLQVPVWNLALGGSGTLWSVTKHDSVVDGRNNSSATLVEVGYNDVILTSNLPTAYKKIASGLKAMFINHFADEYAGASNDPAVSRHGTWTLNQDNRTWGGKTSLGALTTTVNDSIVYRFYGPAAGVVLIGGDSTVFNASIFEAFVDGVSFGQFNTNRITDGATLSGKVNTRLPYGLVVSGLSNGFHTLKVVNVAARSLVVDYFATLSPNKPSFIIFQIPNPAGGTNGNMGQANARIDSVYQTMPADYPVLLVRTNNFYNPATGLSGDNVHPNNTGMKQIYRAFRSVYDSACLHGNGQTIYDGRHWWVTDRGYKRLPTWKDTWNKGEVAAVFQGYIEIPANQSIRQASRNLISGDYPGGWLRIGPDAAQNRTTGTDFVNIGVEAGRDGTTASGGVNIGFRAGRGNITANSQINIGSNAGRESSSSQGIHIGPNSGFWSNGADNLFVGPNAGQGVNGSTNGLRNVGLGPYNLQSLTSGIRNLTGGWNSGQTVTSGGSNILLGYDIQPPSPSTSNYLSIGNGLFATGINSAAGSSVSTGAKFGIVNNSPQVTLHIGGTDAVAMNGGSTAQRPTGAAGYLRWNTDSVRFEFYTGSKWVTLIPGDAQLVNNSSGASGLVQLADGSGGFTANVGFVLNSGKLGVNTSIPNYSVDISGTDAIRIPIGTTGQRPSDNTGLLRYNSDSNEVERNNGIGYEVLATRSWVNTKFTEGTYTPTLTGISNVDAVTLDGAQYTRDGNSVTVYGSLNIDASSALVNTIVDIELPFATSGGALYGTICGASSGAFGRILNSSNKARVSIAAVAVNTDINYTFSFQYRIQ